jgi:hypothetical protein
MITKARCLFCEATIEGECNYMLSGIGLNMDGRCKPKWLKERPEFPWAWNGVNGKVFYLCPNHINKLSEAFKLIGKIDINA